jgi:1,4-dihydroxy-2-naphthoate octaprenyltransferase
VGQVTCAAAALVLVRGYPFPSMSAFARVSAFVRLGRPLFLGGGFVLFGLGAAIAVWAGATLDWGLYRAGQVAVTAFQLMTHYANDHFDYAADRANATPTHWSGGSRVLSDGELPRSVALAAALAFAVVGSAASVRLGLQPKTGPWIVPLLVLMLVLSWAYSAPPLQLHSRGLGELNVSLVVTGLVPFTGFYLQAPDLHGLRPLLLALAPLCLLQFAMILGVEFPDAVGDATANKRTLVVRWGGRQAARVYAIAVTAAYVSLPCLAWAGLPRVVTAAVAVSSPFALWRIWCVVARADWQSPRRFEALSFWAVALLMATSLLELAAFLFLIEERR